MKRSYFAGVTGLEEFVQSYIDLKDSRLQSQTLMWSYFLPKESKTIGLLVSV